MNAATRTPEVTWLVYLKLRERVVKLLLLIAFTNAISLYNPILETDWESNHDNKLEFVLNGISIQ